ncbi:hypothetical protein V1506DRAFT_495861 [Lipomyces tetrasporus]
MEQRDGHIFDPDAHSVRFRATLADCFVIENDASEASCAQNNDENLQKRAIKCFRNDLFDCPGYYFHLRRCNERVDGPRFSLTCSCSNERRTGVRDPSSVQRHTTAKEFFDCHGELHISFSKSNLSATIIYDHKCHAETPKFRITEEIQQYIKAQQLFPSRQIYQNLIHLANSPQFAKTDLHTITRQQVYNVWLSLTKREWNETGRVKVDILKYIGISHKLSCPYSIRVQSSELSQNGKFIVRPPPASNPELFQERWPLVKFSEHELSGPDTISWGVELSDCADDETC